jgi:microcystin-dependent protein
MVQMYVGEVRPFAGTFAPYGWNLCDGSLLSISSYQALYALIGTTYGGDGVNTFGVPDLRGRAMIHQGQGSGLSPYVIGQRAGAEGVSVTTTQMANHPHSFSGNSGASSTPTPGPTVVPATTVNGLFIYDGNGSPTPISAQAVSSVGGSLPHNNRQPYQAFTYIIALEGVFPSRG